MGIFAKGIRLIYRNDEDALAHACTQSTPNNEGAAVKMLSGSVAARGPSNSNTSNEVISVVEIKGATESELVRDLVFVLQGVDGSIFRFNPRTERYIFSGSSNGRDIELSARHGSACQDVCHVGGVYRRLLERCNRLLDDDESICTHAHSSPTAAAFATQIRERLMEYYRLTVTLESRVSGQEWTLQHLQAWVYQPGRQLAALERLTQVCLSENNGGAMISDIITLRDSRPANGVCARRCTSLRSVLDDIVSQTLQPLVATIRLWLTEGRIMKGNEEDFFIQGARQASNNNKNNSSDIWTSAFTIDFDKVPALISEEVALKIFVTGKSINFVRQCCSEGDWLSDQQQQIQQEETDPDSLTNMVQKAYRRETSLVFNLMMNKYRLQDHLLAVKKYLLLSQGDFVGHLLDLMSEQLSTRAQVLRVHTFRDLTDHALRLQRLGSASGNYDQQDEEEFDNRLTARLEKSGLSDTGWEVFSLDYIATQPVSVILHEEAMERYRKLFSISWRLHRAERQLSSAWSQQMIAHRTVLQAVVSRGKQRRRRSEGQPSSSLSTDSVGVVVHLLNICNALRHEMWHLVEHLRSFFAFNVIDTAWQKLRDSLESLAGQQEADLDRVLRLHEEYLTRLTGGHFLNHGDTPVGRKQMKVFDVLNELLNGIYQFTTLQERIYGDLSGAVVSHEADGNEMSLMDEATAAEFKRAVMERREEFLGNLQKFCAGAMDTKTELKHLVNRIDFNCFYY
ncbi:gamma-tubulin complex component, putative [Perkinsus marinus ATCC 50983]|uniref:Gamma-tubulin complex component, putative n=1 Tax=Perkinsus marinus (strain ATCC 50983 / TXsc) TaxID=423536 RepID=C5L9J6_PERM5|nr:gamma-tubulin complex component, putative [Perkinsus marinus ATCC 50983]EER06589.1 gamma-tubulin complex component, putative [Perkinsus marinus ATCC 50983]|eukprot:XP_002774773.1 gamma-tubulin complex component, putative [Perkinsus marinus ATCC 50983]